MVAACLSVLRGPCQLLLLQLSRLAAVPSAAANRGLEESFVVLPGAASVLRPGSTAAANSSRSAAAGTPLQQQQSFLTPTAAVPPAASSTAAAMARAAAQATADRSSAGAGPSSRAAASGLDAKLETLASLCDLASTVTGVDHPLCLDCAAQLKEEVQQQITELNGEIAAYSEALSRLQAEAPVALPQVIGC